MTFPVSIAAFIALGFPVSALAASYTVTVIPAPNGFSYCAMYDINNAGQVAGYCINSASSYQAFVGSPAGSVAIPFPAGWATISYAYGINNSGQVVGQGNNMGVAEAFVGTPAGSQAIPLPSGWGSTAGYAINDSGQFTGSAYNAPGPGPSQAFIGTTSGSTAIPLPSGWSSAFGYGSIMRARLPGTAITQDSHRPSSGRPAAARQSLCRAGCLPHTVTR